MTIAQTKDFVSSSQTVVGAAETLILYAPPGLAKRAQRYGCQILSHVLFVISAKKKWILCAWS